MFLVNIRRDIINREQRHHHFFPWPQRPAPITSQDFFEVLSENEVIVNGRVHCTSITKIDYDVVGAALGEIARRKAMRERNPRPTAYLADEEAMA